MDYLTFEEYMELSPMSALTEDEFATISSIACEIIDSYTFNAIEDYRLMDDDRFAERIRKAVARQIDFIQAKGGIESYLGTLETRPVDSFSVTVGNTSESKTYGSSSTASEGVTREGFIVSPLACAYLKRIQAIGRQIRRRRRCL